MAASSRTVAEHYDAVYANADFFGHQRRLYRSLIRAIVEKSGLPLGSSVLDAGCGQGYLSRFLVDCGMNVQCADISTVGLRSLDRYASMFHGRRVVADVRHPPFRDAFDLVFQRSCSLLNDRSAPAHAHVVDRLTDCAKVGGVVCIVYNSDASGRGGPWIHHRVRTLRAACSTSRLSGLEVYAVNKLDCLLLGRHSFGHALTVLNVAVSRLSRRSCEIVALARRSA